MKNKILSFLFAIVLCVPVMFLASACGGAKLTGIEVDTTNAKTEYFYDKTFSQEFSFEGLVVRALFDNNKKEEVTDFTVDASTFQAAVAGEYTITVTYKEVKTTYTVTVKEKQVERIDVYTGNLPTFYEGDSDIDLSKLVVSKVYNDGTVEQTLEYEADKRNVKSLNGKLVAGTYSIVVNCGTVTKTFTITVVKVAPDRLAVSGMKDSFYVGEDFVTDGLKVQLVYNNGKTEDIAAENYTIDSTNVNSSAPGTYVVKVSSTIDEVVFSTTYQVEYKNYSNFKVSVPNKFFRGQEFKNNFVKVEFSANEGEAYAVVDDWTVEGYTPNKVGVQNVTIKHTVGEKNYSINVEVEVLDEQSYAASIFGKVNANVAASGSENYVGTPEKPYENVNLKNAKITGTYTLAITENSLYYKLGETEVLIKQNGQSYTMTTKTPKPQEDGAVAADATEFDVESKTFDLFADAVAEFTRLYAVNFGGITISSKFVNNLGNLYYATFQMFGQQEYQIYNVTSNVDGLVELTYHKGKNQEVYKFTVKLDNFILTKVSEPNLTVEYNLTAGQLQIPETLA